MSKITCFLTPYYILVAQDVWYLVIVLHIYLFTSTTYVRTQTNRHIHTNKHISTQWDMHVQHIVSHPQVLNTTSSSHTLLPARTHHYQPVHTITSPYTPLPASTHHYQPLHTITSPYTPLSAHTHHYYLLIPLLTRPHPSTATHCYTPLTPLHYLFPSCLCDGKIVFHKSDSIRMTSL